MLGARTGPRQRPAGCEWVDHRPVLFDSAFQERCTAYTVRRGGGTCTSVNRRLARPMPILPELAHRARLVRRNADVPAQRATPSSKIRCRLRCNSCCMSTEITQRQLSNNSDDIMRGLDQGQTFVVTRNGVPVAELKPLHRPPSMSAEAATTGVSGTPSVGLGSLRNDLDQVASQEFEPRA
jgi:antitoxin (DNA-binding transcriptional repressor) of toxin-antitoxin stability system